MKPSNQKRGAKSTGRARSEKRHQGGLLGGRSGQVLVSQQDYDSDWLRIAWPPTGKITIECMNPRCSSSGFDWERLEAAIADALDDGGAVAGSLRCEGTDTLAMSRCTNALVYLWDGDQSEEAS